MTSSTDTSSPSLPTFTSVYGPVTSWRFGRSLGIDPIGETSVCSYRCAYCQLGVIQRVQSDRQLFVSSDRIRSDLMTFAPWDVDVVTLSGSGEPTLATNLGQIIALVHDLTARPAVVLTNGTLLGDETVCQALAAADVVAVKLDAVTPEQWQRVNHPMAGRSLSVLRAEIERFRHSYPGRFAIQTMLLFPWDEPQIQTYIDWIKAIAPDEVQLNTPSRPKPRHHLLDARGNHLVEPDPTSFTWFKPWSLEALHQLGDCLHAETGIWVRCPPPHLFSTPLPTFTKDGSP